MVRRRWETLGCFKDGNVSHNDVVVLLYFGQVNAWKRAQLRKDVDTIVGIQCLSDAYQTP